MFISADPFVPVRPGNHNIISKSNSSFNAMESSGVSIDATNDLTPVLQIATWLLQCISILAILVKMGIKLRVIRDFTQDDVAILIALVLTASRPIDPLADDGQVLSTGQCVAASLQNANGFGQHRAALNQGHIQAALKVLFRLNSRSIPP